MAGFKTPNRFPFTNEQNGPDGKGSAPLNSENGNGCDDRSNTDEFNDTELDAILKNLMETLICCLEPPYDEIVWRAEVLDQPVTQIASDMQMEEPLIAVYLKVGRRALLDLLALVLWERDTD